jgi:hypothetical protein
MRHKTRILNFLNKKHFFTLALPLPLLLSCHQSHSELLGIWVGSYETPCPQEIDPAVAHTLNKIELHLKPHATFTLIQYGLTYEGDFHISGNHLILRLKKLMGRPIERAFLPSFHPPKTLSANIKDNTLVLSSDDKINPVLVKLMKKTSPNRSDVNKPNERERL